MGGRTLMLHYSRSAATMIWRLIVSAPDIWVRGPGFESGISHYDPDALQDHCVIILGGWLFSVNRMIIHLSEASISPSMRSSIIILQIILSWVL